MSYPKTKACTTCGWEYSINDPRQTCKFCGGRFNGGICKSCGKYSTDILYREGPGAVWGMCRECARPIIAKQVAAVDARRRRSAKIAFEEWKQKTRAIPFRPLTEDEWLEAVAFFNGCAICGDETVASRSFFISAADGGKYTAWNVIPMCEKCATVLHFNSNPFQIMDPRINDRLYKENRGDGLKYLSRIKTYLERKIQDELRR